eukprot:Filipodium_phascolosomae@DN1935_c0_g1_i1.p1
MTVESGQINDDGVQKGIQQCRSDLRDFLQLTLYEFIPENSKILVVNSKLPIVSCLRLILDHRKLFCSIFDETTHRFCGFLGLPEILFFLSHYLDFENEDNRLYNMTVGDLKSYTSVHQPSSDNEVNKIEVFSTLYDALVALTRHPDVAQVTVWNQGRQCPLCFITLSNLLMHLIHNLRGDWPVFHMGVRNELNIGTYTNICVVKENVMLCNALNDMYDRKISAVPIVCKQTGQYIGCLHRGTIFSLLYRALCPPMSSVLPLNLEVPVGHLTGLCSQFPVSASDVDSCHGTCSALVAKSDLVDSVASENALSEEESKSNEGHQFTNNNEHDGGISSNSGDGENRPTIEGKDHQNGAGKLRYNPPGAGRQSDTTCEVFDSDISLMDVMVRVLTVPERRVFFINPVSGMVEG